MSEPALARRHGAPPRTRQGWGVPRPVHRFGGRLMEQQLWCWGRDIEHPDGNLLMRHGFERHRNRDDACPSTCYRLDRDRLHVALWGFGMFFGRRDLGGLFLSRFEFRPTWAPVESLSVAVHWPDELPGFARPRGGSQWGCAHRLWKLAMDWIADYEAWARSAAGLPHRRECVEMWMNPFVRADRIAAAWRFLGRRGWERQEQPIPQTLERYTLPRAPR